MNEKAKQEAEKLANAHFDEYLKYVLEYHEVHDEKIAEHREEYTTGFTLGFEDAVTHGFNIQKCTGEKFHFATAYAHGNKHGLEYLSEQKKAFGNNTVRACLIKLCAKMLKNRGNYPMNPEDQDFRMSKRAWRELSIQHDKGDEFFRQVGIELRELADRLKNEGK